VLEEIVELVLEVKLGDGKPGRPATVSSPSGKCSGCQGHGIRFGVVAGSACESADSARLSGA
jgi:hypothetical protein